MAADLKSFQKLAWHYQALTVLAVCGGLLGLLWYQIISPMEVEIEQKGLQLANLQATIAKAVAQQKVLAEFKQQTIQLEKQLHALTAVLPTDKETDEILRQVQRSASTSGLRILRVGPRPIIDHEVYTEWPIDMEVLGTYHNMGTFLDRIRQLPRIVNISSLKVQSRASEGEAAFSASVGATYTATTFVYRGEPAETAPPPVPAAPPR
jgi:type IV pilus assembly protein PilO